MPKKAVYASQSLSIYFSRTDLDKLLSTGTGQCQVYLGEAELPGSKVTIILSNDAVRDLRHVLSNERAIWARQKMEHPKETPPEQVSMYRERMKDAKE